MLTKDDIKTIEDMVVRCIKTTVMALREDGVPIGALLDAVQGITHPKHHLLKTALRFFNLTTTGHKSFEYRINDRDFLSGDTVTLQEYDYARERYTGYYVEASISYVLYANQPHIVMAPNYCVLQLIGIGPKYFSTDLAERGVV